MAASVWHGNSQKTLNTDFRPGFSDINGTTIGHGVLHAPCPIPLAQIDRRSSARQDRGRSSALQLSRGRKREARHLVRQYGGEPLAVRGAWRAPKPQTLLPGASWTAFFNTGQSLSRDSRLLVMHGSPVRSRFKRHRPTFQPLTAKDAARLDNEN